MTFKNLEHLQVSFSKILISKCFKNKIWNKVTLILSPSGFFFYSFGRLQNDDKCQFLAIFVKIAQKFLKPITFHNFFVPKL
jgi:hypothetical protein